MNTIGNTEDMHWNKTKIKLTWERLLVDGGQTILRKDKIINESNKKIKNLREYSSRRMIELWYANAHQYGILNIAQSEKNDQRISPSSGLHDVIVWLSERNT